jgi:hypothetical protein
MKKGLMILALGLVLAMIAMPAGAAKYKDLNGTWSGTWIGYASDSPAGFETTVTLTITGHDATGNFYGTFDAVAQLGLGASALTGTIAINKAITVNMIDTHAMFGIFNGQLTGKGINGILSMWNPLTGINYTGKLKNLIQVNP